MENINYLVESQNNNDNMLAELVQKGLQKRYKKTTPAVVERADRELKVITECGFSHCFLIVYDICRFARSKKIEISSRGTTACSLVNYLLGITEIDPLVYNLPFERFLNSDYLMSKRGATHPFFGLDFSIDYDEINSVVVKYLKKKYGKNNVLRCVGENKGRLFVHASTLLIDAQMQEKVEIIKFDGQDVANVMGIGADRQGIFQVDFFTLQSLKLLNEMKSVLDSNGKKQFAKACKRYDDEATLSLFREGRTEDIFQFQSPAIIEQVKQTPVVTFDTLLAMMALYRPGSMERIPEYIDRNCGDEAIRFLFQEDVINYLHEVGFSLNEADTIRKDISKRKIAEIEGYRERFMQYTAEKGMDAGDATEKWEELNSYVLYSFCKAHAVAYMMLAYKLAYFKAHYPDEWKAANEKISESAD